MANNMVSAGTIGTKDIIEVPVEGCQVVSVERVPGQLKNRRNYLIKVKVVPVSGPWANCEGVFVVESSDLIPMVKKHTSRDRRRAALGLLMQRIATLFSKPKAVEVPRLEVKLTGDYT